MVKQEEFPKITEEALDRLRRHLGVEMVTNEPFNRYATPDTIRHFAHGMGDVNPLFTEEEYAAATRWHSVVAPPTFLFTCFGQGQPEGLRGIHSMWAGASFEMEAPLVAGTRIHGTVMLSGLTPKPSTFSGRAVLQEYTFTFRTPDGRLLGRAREWLMRTERGGARERGKYNYLELARYSPEDIERIFADYDKEVIRGATPRHWEDVEVGEELPHVVKGPLRVTDNIAWKIGWSFRPFVFAHKIAVEFYKKHPFAFIVNESGIPDVPERVHWDTEFAQQVGVPGAYDYGPQRVSWLGQVVTNWMGDDGIIRKFSAQVRRFNLNGDTHWLKGKVAAKRIENGERVVDLELWGHDQRGEVTINGTAVVALPSQR